MTVADLLDLFRQRGDSEYGGEDVTQLEHALQAAYLAEQAEEPAELIVAALLHDVGHLLHDLPDDAPDQGVDDHHENSASNYLKDIFPKSVTEPIRLHVTAKRYLCQVDEDYIDQLSEPSIVSLRLQGGPMSQQEAQEFDSNPHAQAAVRLRRWDDAAKVVGMKTPSLEHFFRYVHQVAATG